MPYNGNGVFELPGLPDYPAVPATVIRASQFNNVTQDLADGLSSAITTDGQSQILGNIPMGGYKLTGLGLGSLEADSARFSQLFSQGLMLDVPSAATTDIGSPLSNFINITGTQMISSLGTNYNGPKFLRFAASLTIVNAASITLPGNVDLLVGAGDTAIAYPNSGATGWIITAYSRAKGATVNPDVRQTVLSGPVDANGHSAFGGATGASTVTAAGTLLVTAANGSAQGVDGRGNLDRVGSITNPSWTGLSVNGSMYLYIDIGIDGTCTTGATSLAPTYRFGGADVITNNQFTFNISSMVGKVGNGAAAVQTYRVYVGVVGVAAGVVTAIIWYALRGKYYATNGATPSTAPLTLSHNLGMTPMRVEVGVIRVEPVGTDQGYNTGDVIQASQLCTNTGLVIAAISSSASSVTIVTSSGTLYSMNKVTGALAALALAQWDTTFYADRGW